MTKIIKIDKNKKRAFSLITVSPTRGLSPHIRYTIPVAQNTQFKQTIQGRIDRNRAFFSSPLVSHTRGLSAHLRHITPWTQNMHNKQTINCRIDINKAFSSSGSVSQRYKSFRGRRAGVGVLACQWRPFNRYVQARARGPAKYGCRNPDRHKVRRPDSFRKHVSIGERFQSLILVAREIGSACALVSISYCYCYLYFWCYYCYSENKGASQREISVLYIMSREIRSGCAWVSIPYCYYYRY